MTTDDVWGDSVVPGKYAGHDGLVYKHRPDNITAVLDHSARWGDAVFMSQGQRSVSFRQHLDDVNRIAVKLGTLGVSRGDRVGIYASNCPEWVSTFFAILQVGAVVVPFNGWWSPDEVAHACTAVSPTVVIVDERRMGSTPKNVNVLPMTEVLAATDYSDVPINPSEPAHEGDTAMILFTAGTTEFPKGAVLSHRALVANLQTLLVVARKLPHQIKAASSPSVALVGLPLFHIGAIQLILVPLMTGSQIVFLEGRFDPSAVLETIARKHVTMFSGVPTMMERLLADPGVSIRDLTSLRTVVLGGSPVDASLLERIQVAFPSSQRGVGQTYGLTEAGGVVSTGVGQQIKAHPGSSGRLAPVVEVQIRQPGADGNGNIYFRSPAGMDGYWASVEQDVDTDGWIRTGDIGHLDEDNFLYITGRTKDMIIRGGENVASARVEAVIRQHELVVDAAVVGLPDVDLGEIVAAVVQIKTSARLSQLELEDFVRPHLAHFAVPSKWWIQSENLPTNDAGKVLKRELQSTWLQRDMSR